MEVPQCVKGVSVCAECACVCVCVSGYGLTEAAPSLLGLAANVTRFILFTYLPLIRLKQQVAKHQFREGLKERERERGGGQQRAAFNTNELSDNDNNDWG